MDTLTKESTYFVIHFRDPKTNKPQSLKAKTIEDSKLGLSFISISDFIFESHLMIIDQEEENLRKKYEHTKSLHLSIYHILSIEEVGQSNKGLTFKNDKSNILLLNRETDPS